MPGQAGPDGLGHAWTWPLPARGQLLLAPPAAPAPRGTPAPYLACTVQPTGGQEGCRGLLHEGPRERGTEASPQRLQRLRQRQRPREEGAGRGSRRRGRWLRQTDRELPVQEAAAGGGSGEPTRVPSEWLRAEAGPLQPSLGPGLWALDEPALGRSLGSPAPAVRGGGPRAPLPSLPLPCLPGAKHRDIDSFPEGPLGQPEWRLKLALLTRSGYFRRLRPWLSPRQGGTSTFQGPWLSTPCGLNSRERPGRSPLALGGPGPAAGSLAKLPQG